MADWADEKANTLRIDLVESPANTAYFLEQVSQALREAEARGMKKAAEIARYWEPKKPATRVNVGIAEAIVAQSGTERHD